MRTARVAPPVLNRDRMEELNEIGRIEIQPGWAVLDADGQAVGTVDEAGEESFTVRIEGPVDAIIGIAYADIESADDGRVVLSVSREDLDAAVDVGAP
jgi:hypothetical protein